MNKAIELIKQLINEHEMSGYCTNQREAEEFIERDPVVAFDKFYDLGRYETLVNLLNELERIGE